MFKKIKELITGEKKPESPFEITLDEIPGWLDTEVSACEQKRTKEMTSIRDTLAMLISKMNQVITEIGSEEHDEVKHPKVEQVIRHSLPQFKKRVETQISREFMGDDEEVYHQIAECVQGCFLAFKGPGKYLHQLYPDGIKDFRDVLDSMGREMNSMTRIIKVARDHLSEIDAVKRAYQRYLDVNQALDDHAAELRAIETKIQETDDEISHLQKEEGQLKGSDSYREYEELISQSEQLRENHLIEQERYESACRTAVSVCKRASRIYVETGRNTEQKIIDSLEEACSGFTRNCHDLKVQIQHSEGLIFALMQSNDLTLKNTFEKALFSDKDSLIQGLAGSCTAAQAAYNNYLDRVQIRSEHPVHTTLPHVMEAIEKQLHMREKNREEERIHSERKESLITELKQAETNLVNRIAQYLKKDPSSVMISGLNDNAIITDTNSDLVDNSGEDDA